MKPKHTFAYFISILLLVLCSSAVWAQEGNAVLQDTTGLDKRDSYGLRIGVDLSKPIRSFLDDNYNGFEINADFRIKKRLYIAAELGNETNRLDFSNITASGSGSYLKGGVNHNFYNNWLGERNLIFAGVRIGYSAFDQELESFTINAPDIIFDPDDRTDTIQFDGLSAFWLEVQIGLQVEILSNIFMGINLQIQNLLTETAPDDFQNVYIPGFGEPTDGSNFSIGFGYTISYFIPVLRKK